MDYKTWLGLVEKFGRNSNVRVHQFCSETELRRFFELHMTPSEVIDALKYQG